MPVRAPPGGLTTALFVGTDPCGMPFPMTLKTHYLLIPELFSRDICSRLYEAGGKGQSPPAEPIAFLASAESFWTFFTEDLILAFMSSLWSAPKNLSPAKFSATAALYCATRRVLQPPHSFPSHEHRAPSDQKEQTSPEADTLRRRVRRAPPPYARMQWEQMEA